MLIVEERDLRVRWAPEEVGQRYDVRLLNYKTMKQPAHLALQPFGQIPTYEEGIRGTVCSLRGDVDVSAPMAKVATTSAPRSVCRVRRRVSASRSHPA